jgi:hypothetical protein
VVAVAAFIHLVHLGSRIEVPGIGAFDSRYTAPQLTTLDDRRGETWRQHGPPLVRPPRFSREDQFMTEGLQHVQARNTAWQEGDAVTAWRENAILERFFRSVLDTPSYVSRAGHRWPAAQRVDAERRAAPHAAEAFVSTAFPYPIYRWSPVTVWLVALALAGAAWIGGRRAASRRPAATAD